MKTKLLALFSLLLFVSSSYSQNWKLLDENKTYFYKHVDSLYITNTIEIDNTTFSPTDSIYHSNTTLRVCDTCTVIPPEAIDGLLYHFHFPEIFGYFPTYKVSSNDYHFDNRVIKHHAQLSDSWIFDSGLGITATVVAVDDSTIFSVLDSIKIIQLSTLDTIIISKNYGIQRYPDFENPGKYFSQTGYHEGLNSFGEYLPNARTLYNYQVGDVFCYESSDLSWGMQTGTDLTYRATILEDLSSADTIKYRIKILGIKTMYYIGPPEDEGFPTSSNYLNHEVFWSTVDHPGIIENTFGIYGNNPSSYAEQFEEHYYHFYSIPSGEYLNEADDLYAYDDIIYTDAIYDNTFGYVKRSRPFKFYSDSLCYINYENGESYDRSANGVGKLESNFFYFETGITNDLIACLIDGDTIGTICYYPEDLATEEIPVSKLSIYPNPTNSQITIPVDLQMISIYSIAGDLVLQLENPTQQIYVGDLPAGIYFVHGFDLDGNRMETKLVISK